MEGVSCVERGRVEIEQMLIHVEQKLSHKTCLFA